MNRENYVAAKKLIAASKRILVSGHLSPDGDSLGSMLALTRLLRGAIIEPRESPSGLKCPETRIRLEAAISFFAAA